MNKEFVAWLKRARALVAAGWTRGVMHRVRGNRDCYCAYGALNATNERLKPMCWSFNGGSYRELAEWNDRLGRKKSEVLAMFDNSIRALDGK